MRKIASVLLIMILFSCQNGSQAPTDQEIERATLYIYEKRNQKDGGGGWDINEVKVLRTWKGRDERHYNAEVAVKGIHTSPALPERRPDEVIDEKIEVRLIWRDGQWIIDDE